MRTSHISSFGLGAIVLLLVAFPAPATPVIVVQPVDSGVSSISPSFSTFLANEEAYATRIFAQIGLSIDFLPVFADSTLPPDYGTDPNEASYFFNSSSFRPAPEITVWFVGSIPYNGNNDRGLSEQNGPEIASWIAANAVNDTLAHELGNDLTDLQEISGTPSNLMEVGTDRNIPSSPNQIFVGGSDDQITTGPGSQAQRMLGNTVYVQNVPEPPGAWLAVMAAAGIAVLSVFSRRPFRT